MPAFYPEHAYDIAGLLKALRELPSGEEVRELRDHIKRLNKAHSLAVARRDDQASAILGRSCSDVAGLQKFAVIETGLGHRSHFFQVGRR